MSYLKPKCYKNVLLKRHGQFVLFFFSFFLFLKHGKESESFTFCGIKDQIFGDNKDIVSVPYLTFVGSLAYNLFCILKSYGFVSLTLKTSLNIAGDRPCRYLLISIAKLWTFLWWIEKKPSFSRSLLKDEF